MPDWYLVPCLVQLRTEFNALSPDRDKGADGSIGDTAHQAESTSDHNPDALGRVLAVDIDSTGPWPADFDALVKYIVGRQRSGADNRLQYVIWNRRIASRSTNWAWATYTGTADPHTGHAHFSARHDHTGNTSGSSWGLTEEFDVALTPDDIGKIATAVWAARFNTSGSITAYSRLADIAGGVAALQVTAQGVLANVQADDGDLAAIKADALAKYNGLVAEINQVDDEVWAKISDPSTPNEQVAAALVSLLGPRKAAVVALMQQS
jgi:hypothetical protein